MNSNQTTTSTALYFDRNERQSVSIDWFERAHQILVEFNSSPVLFTAGSIDGETFLLDDCHVLSERGKDIVLWGETIQARGHDLAEALRNGNINCLQLDSPHPESSSRADWGINISTSLISGICHIGVDEHFVFDPVALLHRAYKIVKGLFNVRYGIAYKMPLSDEPDCYASGTRTSSFAETIYWIRHRREWEQRQKTPNELWSEELRGQRRHLTGLFRGAYPANVLSEAHVRSAALLSRGIGKLTELDHSLWLWELTDEELPEAERILESRGVLVRQTAQT